MWVLREDESSYKDSLKAGERFFPRLSERFGRGPHPPVTMEGGGKTAAVWQEEFYYPREDAGRAATVSFCCHFPEEGLRAVAGHLDLTMLSSFGILWFDRINEYSWEIIRLLNAVFPEKTVLTGDERVFLFPDISAAVAEAPEGPGTGCFYEGHVWPEKPGHYAVCSLMTSLTWARTVRENPGAPRDGTVLLIDPRNYDAVLGDIVLKVICYTLLARRRGWEPVVFLNHGSVYDEREGESFWQKVFENVGTVTPEETGEFSRVISVSDNREDISALMSNPYTREILESGQYRKVDLFLRPEWREKVLSGMPEALQRGEKSVGIVLRRSDYDVMEGVETDAEEYLEWADRWRTEQGSDRIFLATEDAQVLEASVRKWGSRLLYVDQKRVEADDPDSRQLLARRLGRRYGSPADFLVDYLTVVASLCFCEAVAGNQMCGAFVLIDALAEGLSGRKPKLMIREAKKTVPAAADNGIDVIFRGITPEEAKQRLAPGEDVILYGAGKNGREFRACLLGKAGTILFCDRRAEEGMGSVDGCTVISPAGLPEIYSGQAVIVTPYHGRDGIRNDLLRMGIPENRIL